VEKEHYEVICETGQYDKLAGAFSNADIIPDSSELAYLPENLIAVTDEDVARKVLKLIENLEDLEDVKAVHGNYDMDEALLEAINS
jgi:transcriptional/translational regulatory protein YebC/TACO1